MKMKKKECKDVAEHLFTFCKNPDCRYNKGE